MKKITIICSVLLAGVTAACMGIYFKNNSKETITLGPTKTEVITLGSIDYKQYALRSNGLEAFDLLFLQLDDNKKNNVYSPLSIKYALTMLADGATGETRKQIDNVLGTYSPTKYTNNANMAFANALFVKNSFKDSVKSTYVDSLANKYNASVVYDSFETPNVVNSWIKDSTLGLIDNLYNDISSVDIILANALGIDMEWINPIQQTFIDGKAKGLDLSVSYKPYHQNFYYRIHFYSNRQTVEFAGKKVAGAEIGAVINNYDIIKELGEKNIRQIVTADYQEKLNDGTIEEKYCYFPSTTEFGTWLDKYISDLRKPYGDVQKSTDFSLYSDDNVKVFAKDLKEYNGTQLQYVGIMPTSTSLDEYISNINADTIDTIIKNLKPIEKDNFKEGVLTKISGTIPFFNFEKETKLMEVLKRLGITNVFDQHAAELTELSSNDSLYIADASHKATIEFTNEGIKAAAVSITPGDGGGECGYDYVFDIPVETIDLTFNNPYMFIIRDKKAGEVWFAGSVYELDELKNNGLNDK